MSRTGDDLPIWARPEPSGRRPRLSHALIAETALRIADEEGFDAVSMRHVATTLGTGAMTLYNYVRTKDELVSLMDDALMAELLVPGELPAHWRAALEVIAGRTRDGLVRHPWALMSLGQAQFGPNAMRHFEQSLAALAGTELTAADKFDVLAVVDDYVHGNAARTGEVRGRMAAAEDDEEMVAAAIEFGMAQLATGEFPHTAALFGGDTPHPALDKTSIRERFERGLAALLDGLAARYGLPD